MAENCKRDDQTRIACAKFGHFFVVKYSRDVSGEARDEDGRWTDSGGVSGEKKTKPQKKMSWVEHNGKEFHSSWSYRSKTGISDSDFYVGHHVVDGVQKSTPFLAELQKIGKNFFDLDEKDPEQKFAIHFESAFKQPIEEFLFTNVRTGYGKEKNKFGVTGTGNAREVITKATISLMEAIEKWKPPAVYFTAKESSRSSLYEYLAKKSESQTGYVAYSVKLGDKTPEMFVLVNPEKTQQFEKLCKSERKEAIRYSRLSQW